MLKVVLGINKVGLSEAISDNDSGCDNIDVAFVEDMLMRIDSTEQMDFQEVSGTIQKLLLNSAEKTLPTNKNLAA